jgi:hypothetical protein
MKSNLLNRVLAGGFSALLAVLLAKTFSVTHPAFIVMLTLLAGFMGYIFVAPKEFYKKLKIEIKNLLEKLYTQAKKKLAQRRADNERKTFIKKHYREYLREFRMSHLLENLSMAGLAASMVSTGVLCLGCLFSNPSNSGSSVGVAGLIAYALLFCIVFLAGFVHFLEILEDKEVELCDKIPDFIWIASEITCIRESNQAQKKVLLQMMFLPIYLMILVVQRVVHYLEKPTRVVQAACIALARTCVKVQSLGRYTTAISAMLGFATGIYCNNSELVALFVGGLSGEALLHLSKFMLRFLPNPETPLPSFW